MILKPSHRTCTTAPSGPAPLGQMPFSSQGCAKCDSMSCITLTLFRAGHTYRCNRGRHTWRAGSPGFAGGHCRAHCLEQTQAAEGSSWPICSQEASFTSQTTRPAVHAPMEAPEAAAAASAGLSPCCPWPIQARRPSTQLLQWLPSVQQQAALWAVRSTTSYWAFGSTTKWLQQQGCVLRQQGCVIWSQGCILRQQESAVQQQGGIIWQRGCIWCRGCWFGSGSRCWFSDGVRPCPSGHEHWLHW